MRAWSCLPILLTLGVLLACVRPAFGETPFYSTDFEGTVGAEWSNAKTSVTPVGARRYLGDFSNQAVTLTLGSIPAHASLRVTFDVYAIRTWDGNGTAPGCCGPDVFRMLVVGGATVINTTFGAGIDSSGARRQAYPGSYPSDAYPIGTGASETNSLGYSMSGTPCDAVYRLSTVVPHHASSATLEFSASGLQEITDESWGLDNVTVSLLGDAETPSIATDPGDTTPPTGFFDADTIRVEFDASRTDGGLPAGVKLTEGAVISTATFDPTFVDYAQDSPSSDIYASATPHHLTLTFDPDVLGGLPTTVGLVFTDTGQTQGATVTMETWSGPNRTGERRSLVRAFRGNDGTYARNFGDDSLLGLRGSALIRSVHMTSNASSGGFEADVLRFGGIRPRREKIVLRSGAGVAGGPDSTVHMLVGADNTPFANTFTASDFASARSGPAARILTSRYGAWIAGLAGDADSKWINTSDNRGTGGNALYAIDFNLTPPFSDATLSAPLRGRQPVGAQPQRRSLRQRSCSL